VHDDERDPRDEREAQDIDDGSDDLLIRRISRELQAPAEFAADFDARVMAAVRAAAADDAVERRFAAAQAEAAPSVAPVPAAVPASRPGLVRRAAAWVARPRTFSVSPLAGLAVAAGLVFMFAVGRRSASTEGGSSVVARVDSGAVRDTGMSLAPGSSALRPVASTRADAPQMVAFVLVAPDARQVSLVGDFNDWNAQATPLTPVKRGGVWTITVPLKPGRYNYNFVVDGTRWMPDPAAPAAPTDDFGTPASIVTVAGAQS